MKKFVYLFCLPLAIAMGACTAETIPNKDGGDDDDDGSVVVVIPNETTPVTGTTDGSGSYTFASTGDPESDDDIANTTFTRLITVTYSSDGAVVDGFAGTDKISVSTSGSHVYIVNTEDDAEVVLYQLSGSSSDGSFTLYSSRKQALLLKDLSLSCKSGAAINNQSHKRTFVMLEGSNTLSDNASAAYPTTDGLSMKGVFFSEGQLVFSGSGSLSVTANNKQLKSCIASDDYIRLMQSPVLKLTTSTNAGHGLRGNDYVQISDGSLTIDAKANMKKGISSDGYVLVEGGTSVIIVSGGTAKDSEENEYKGTAGIKADNYFEMTGGSVTIKNTGAGGKGISAGSQDYYTTNGAIGDSKISGGTLSITTSGSESNGETAKGIKIGFAVKNGNKVTSSAGNLIISGGSTVVNVSRSEGLEAKGNLTFNGGETYVSSAGDDAINCQGEMNVNDGFVYAYSSANDAMDANGNLKLNGGYVFAVCTKGSPEVALDANTEDRYKLYINKGATLVAYGGLESGYSASQDVKSLSGTANAWNALYGTSGFIAAFKAPSGLSSFAVSAPSLSSGYKGVSVGNSLCNGVWADSGISGGTQVTLGTYSGNQGGPGGGGPGGGGRP